MPMRDFEGWIRLLGEGIIRLIIYGAACCER